MSQMTLTEILEICRERANQEPPDRATQRVLVNDFPMDRSRAVYSIPHSDTKYALTSAFEQEGFSLIPTNVEGNPTARYAQYWGIKRKAIDWRHELYWRHKAHGIQLFMGHASEKGMDGVVYYPICWDIEVGLLKEHLEVFERVLRWALKIPNVSIIISKSGGFRIGAWVPFVRPKTEQIIDRREWKEGKNTRGVTYAEILSETSLARVDDRYRLAVGDVAKWPVLTEEEFLKPLAWLTPLDGRLAQPNRGAVVEEDLDADLPEDLTWRDGKYVLISVRRYDCEMGHKSNPTVEYRKYRDGSIKKHCYAGCPEKIVLRGQDNSVAKIIADAPPVETQENPSFPYFTVEERQVIEEFLKVSPDAGWHGQVPYWTTNYKHLSTLTNHFIVNGIPDAVMKHRVWWTRFEKCPICEASAAKWIDRWQLKAGFYCGGCRANFPLGSYLELELNRKLANSVVSDFDGYLGDDPEFQDFRLWQPGILTYLGAAMATGKTTEIFNAIRILVSGNIGRGIVLVPRISLAQFLASYYREKHGVEAWGLWHTGSGSQNQFIGTQGVIACLPSLPRVIEAAKKEGFILKDFYIAIDEIDFGYQLFSLAKPESIKVKDILQQSVDINGLVVAGQTEYTAALESFAAELERDQQHEVQGFYNTATPVDSMVVLHRCLKQEGQEALMLAEAVELIREALALGQNVYVFCQTRRQTIVLGELFAAERPVVYNGYTKGDQRCQEVLRRQCVTDTKLFISNDAAGVGISLLDPNARTIIIVNKLYGSLNLSMGSQKILRNRNRPNADIYLIEPNFPLPVRPSDAENVSLYHQSLKQAGDIYPTLPKDAIKRNARSYALSTLADADPATFLRHHVNLAGMAFVECSVFTEPDGETVDAIKVIKKNSIYQERTTKCQRAAEILSENAVLTEREISRAAMKGRLLPMPTEQLAQEYANAAVRAIGWNGEIDRNSGDGFSWLTDEHRCIAIELVRKNINLEKLEKQRRGWIAVHFSDWMHQRFQRELAKADPEALYGEALEMTAIADDRFRGALLNVLLGRLKGVIFTQEEFAEKVRSLLNTRYGNDTYLRCIEQGALGIEAYRTSRFLKIADDNVVLEWTRNFIKEWYPVQIAKRGEYYALQPDPNIGLRCDSFASWLRQQEDTVVFDQVPIFEEFAQLPDPLAKMKALACFLWEEGHTQVSIEDRTGISRNTIRKVTKERYRRNRREELYALARRMRRAGETHKVIEDKTELSRNTISKVTKDVNESEENRPQISQDLLDSVLFLLYLAFDLYNSIEIATILDVPRADVNDALEELMEEGLCIRYERDDLSDFLVAASLLSRGHFEVFLNTKDGPLLARGTVYGEDCFFMLCDLEMLKARGETDLVIDGLFEEYELSDEASVIYDDFRNWRAIFDTLDIRGLPELD